MAEKMVRHFFSQQLQSSGFLVNIFLTPFEDVRHYGPDPDTSAVFLVLLDRSKTKLKNYLHTSV